MLSCDWKILFVGLVALLAGCGDSSALEGSSFARKKGFSIPASLAKDTAWTSSVEAISAPTPSDREEKLRLYAERYEELKRERQERFKVESEARRQAFEKECQDLKDAEARRKQNLVSNRLEVVSSLAGMKARAADKQEVYNGMREFALKESPVLWKNIQALRAEVEVRDAKIEEFKRAAKASNRDFKGDSEFETICKQRNRIMRTLRTILEKLNEAYLLKKQYDAMPTKEEYQSLMKKAVEDGLQEVQLATERYEELKKIRLEGVK